jgi:hypothetical protein
MTFLSGGDLMAIVQGFPEESVRRAYLDGPESSEQLLHPEKFWDDETRDDPVPVTVPSPAGLLGKRWSLAADGVLGELTIAVLVGAETPVPTGPDVLDTGAWTNEAATGWGGDRWQVWAKGRKTVLLLLTIWDSAADASEFAAALPEGQGMEWRVADRRVAIVAGDTGRKASRLLDRMLARTTPPAD